VAVAPVTGPMLKAPGPFALVANVQAIQGQIDQAAARESSHLGYSVQACTCVTCNAYGHKHAAIVRAHWTPETGATLQAWSWSWSPSEEVYVPWCGHMTRSGALPAS
jgi:hypothetical protein